TPGGAPPLRRMYAPNPATPSLRSTAETFCSKFSVIVCGRRGSEEATLRARRAAISTPHVPPFPCYGGGGRDASNCARPASTLSTPARNDQSCVRDARAQRAALPPRPSFLCAVREHGRRPVALPPSQHHRLPIRAKHFLERRADLAQGGLGLHRVDQIGHQILISRCSLLQGLQGAGHSEGIATGPQVGQTFRLGLFHFRTDLQDRNGRFVRLDVFFDADDDPLFPLHLALVPKRGLQDLPLREPL